MKINVTRHMIAHYPIGLEGLKNLCLSSCNHLYVIEYLTQSHYLQVVQLLLVPDVLLLHSVLETIYTLTSIGTVYSPFTGESKRAR